MMIFWSCVRRPRIRQVLRESTSVSRFGPCARQSLVSETFRPLDGELATQFLEWTAISEFVADVKGFKRCPQFANEISHEDGIVGARNGNDQPDHFWTYERRFQ
jgi:hypothetical protein